MAWVSQRGDGEKWVIFMLKAVASAANLTYNKINDIIATKDAILQMLVEETDIRRLEQLVDITFEQPYIRVKNLSENRTYAVRPGITSISLPSYRYFKKELKRAFLL